MPKPKYTLEPLEKLRDGKVDEAKRQLAGAVTEREKAAAQRQLAEQKKQSEEAAAAALREAERAKLEGGALSVLDLALAGAWEIGARMEAERLAAEVAKKKEQEASAAAREGEARAEVAIKRADAEVVHKDHERFRTELRRREQAKEEEAAEEAWRPRS